eukprot:CAMPEP_0197845694 /NCGR_PEP_ID=MMETSP1438-20131217/2586_1 /TAXON_ID=1461541 /ORGANISM="Pterosperma sp., Strain CCMP1384" /LENGTH=67 /DNA_ID=CAMNT_0043457087 /DNA_START=83 /DNA_END=286 /DNA_ORIENTATION=+
MVRGHAKEVAQQKNAAKKKDQKGSQKDAQKAGLALACPICKTPFAHKNMIKQHYDSKHPKEAIPDLG